MEMFAGQTPVIGRGCWALHPNQPLHHTSYLDPVDWDKAHRQAMRIILYSA
jgi:hypothetical protein